ncbi:MAG TPA: hypothetical protein VGM82_22535 [Gemmatimonadaceae bacterium]|jgi:hypothetical protein
MSRSAHSSAILGAVRYVAPSHAISSPRITPSSVRPDDLLARRALLGLRRDASIWPLEPTPARTVSVAAPPANFR